MERIGFGPRLGAALIDAVIIAIGMSILGTILGGGAIGLGAGMGGTAAVTGFSFGLIIITLVPLAYSSTEIFMAATPGKMILKLAIRNQDGTPAPQEVLIKRWALKNCSFFFRVVAVVTGLSLFGVLGGIAGLVIFVGCFMTLKEDKLALHDKIANTAVYKVTA